MQGTFFRKLERLKWSIKYRGFFNVVIDAFVRCIPGVAHSDWYSAYKENQFDRRYNVETSSDVAVADLELTEEQRSHAVEYAPTYGLSVGLILESLNIDHSQYSFVDYGCGKGRVLLIASEFSFPKIIGVELSESVYQTAVKNVDRYRSRTQQCRSVECLHSDATEFSIPETPVVLYFFNPFDEHILAKVLDNIQQSLSAIPRDMIVIYSNPVHRQLFDESPFWTTRLLTSGLPEDDWVIYQSAPNSVQASENRQAPATKNKTIAVSIS